MKWILISILVLFITLDALAEIEKDSFVCCFADMNSELSILQTYPLTKEQHKIHNQKLREIHKRKLELAKERRKKNGEPEIRYECVPAEGIYEKCTHVKIYEPAIFLEENSKD